MSLRLQISDSVENITINDRTGNIVSLPMHLPISKEAAKLIQAIPASIQDHEVKMWLAKSTEVNTTLSKMIPLSRFEVMETDGEYKLQKTVSNGILWEFK